MHDAPNEVNKHLWVDGLKHARTLSSERWRSVVSDGRRSQKREGEGVTLLYGCLSVEGGKSSMHPLNVTR